MRIYTKSGDNGQTGLLDGSRVPKSDLRCHCFGEIDELNSFLGYIESVDEEDCFPFLNSIQSHLFTIASVTANPGEVSNDSNQESVDDEVYKLEIFIDELAKDLPPLKNFILPGGSNLACIIHLARCVCRRAERNLTELYQKTEPYKHGQKYLNRLSDLLFMMARHTNQRKGVEDTIWKKI
ncbi:cob(I)yrinic acid a,c-diamide adenosyltransferase [Candidatus Riflebacteria bacterium]